MNSQNTEFIQWYWAEIHRPKTLGKRAEKSWKIKDRTMANKILKISDQFEPIGSCTSGDWRRLTEIFFQIPLYVIRLKWIILFFSEMLKITSPSNQLHAKCLGFHP